MNRAACYDVTRLLTRILNATPNGIDRIDFALATHVLASYPAPRFGTTATGFGARLLSGQAALEAVQAIGAHWGETRVEAGEDVVYQRAVTWLRGETPAQGSASISRRRRIGIPKVAGWVRRHGLPLTRRPGTGLPRGAVYVNSSQFPLWVASSFEWLEQRRDVKAVFFIHDLLPVLMPEYFREAELERHKARLRNFARFAAGAVVTTPTVAADLHAHMKTLGRQDTPVFVSPTPISPVFATPRVVDPALANARPYFVLCSTLEPRKNHLMILAVWRALVERLGSGAPRLVLVGTRGWHYGPILDLVARSPALKDHVLEVGGLSTPGLKRLIDNARAVLMPTFGEGYGLPVHEALAAGTPVVAADIPVFRDLPVALGHNTDALTLCSPLNGDAWLETIAAMTSAPRPQAGDRHAPEGWATYFDRLDGFLDAL